MPTNTSSLSESADALVGRIRNRIHDAPLPTEYLLDEAADTIASLLAALRAIIDRSHNDPIGTSKVIDMREIARAALGQGGE